MTDRLQQRLDDLGRALDRFDEALTVSRDAPLAIDGTIQRFEFTFELAWKTAQMMLQGESVVARSPLETLREANRMGWLSEEEPWLQMLKDRNRTVHTYNEAVADQIYTNARANAPAIRALYERLLTRAQAL